LGFTVSFLARVKPEMLGISEATVRTLRPEPSAEAQSIIRPSAEVTPSAPTGRDTVRQALPSPPPALLLLVALTLLFAVGTARAHRLDVAFQVLPDKQVRIESWFDLGGVPKGAKVQVFRPGEQLFAEGILDDRGHFVFHFSEAEELRVVVYAGAGHRKEFIIHRKDLEQGTSTSPVENPPAEREFTSTAGRIETEEAWRERLKDVLIGISFLLALAAFVLSWRNGRKLKSLQDTRTPPQPQDRAE
jgi:nickel transport protein